jgi:hypothetical protein
MVVHLGNSFFRRVRAGLYENKSHAYKIERVAHDTWVFTCASVVVCKKKTKHECVEEAAKFHRVGFLGYNK